MLEIVRMCSNPLSLEDVLNFSSSPEIGLPSFIHFTSLGFDRMTLKEAVSVSKILTSSRGVTIRQGCSERVKQTLHEMLEAAIILTLLGQSRRCSRHARRRITCS